jgi:lysophospholipase L1-like esterase
MFAGIFARASTRASKVTAATTILCFGDSWTYGNANGLQEQLQKHGHRDIKVVNKDFWGSTAEYFAKNPKLLPDAVTNHQAEYVLLSMGGNDFKNIYWRHKQYVTPWTAVAGIEVHIRTVLDALFAEHPEVKVVAYGYDFPGSVDKVLSGTFWDSNREVATSVKFAVWLYNTVGIRLINYSAMQFGHTLEKLSKEYSQQGFSFTYVPLWGSLQSAAEGKQDYTLSKPSPSEFMNDPIHANSKGYNILIGNLYNAYFGKALTQHA